MSGARDLPARRRLDGPQTGAYGRDAKGRFLPGNPGGGRPPSNPFARYGAELRAVLLAEVTPTELRAVVRQVLRLAKRGSLPATELLLKWTLGGPPPAVDPDKMDAHEREVRAGRWTLLDELAEPAGSSTPAAELDDDPAAPDDSPEAPLEAPPAWAAPSLQALVGWAVQATLAALPPAAPPPDPWAGWQAFVTSRLEFAAGAAVDVDQLLLAYWRWCASHGEAVLAEADLLAWLAREQGTTLHTGAHTQIRTVVGVRVTP